MAINVSEGIIFICARWPLKLHVADVVTCLNDDPSMQMYLQTASVSKKAKAVTCIHLHVFMLSIIIEEIFIVRLLGRIRRQ
jgi:hypothetical protein